MITNENIKRIAKLARLKLAENELGIFADQLTNIENMIKQLEEADCSNIEPLTSVNDAAIKLRSDEVLITNIEDQIFSNVPGKTAEFAKEIKCFVVPKVVE